MSIKVVEFFSGIGSQHKALTNLMLDFEVVATSDWDVNAIIAYDAIHTDDGIDYSEGMNKTDILGSFGESAFSTDGKSPCNLNRMATNKLIQLYNANLRSKNMGDITKIKSVPIANLWTYSFPCTTISVAGKQDGIAKNSGTESSLLWEVERLLEISKSKNELPEYLLLENVKNLIGKEFKPYFDDWINRLDQVGYNTYWQVINSKNMGIPQNRERVFAVSIRKDIDDKEFKFPKPFDNGLRLKDFLEKYADKKYYISENKTSQLLEQLKDKQNNRKAIQINRDRLKTKDDDICSCLDANYWKGLDNHAQRTGIMEPNVLSPKRTEYGKQIRKEYEAGLIDEQIGNMRTFEPRTDGISNTLTTVLKDNYVCMPCITPDRVEKRQNGRRFKEDGEPMFTITSQDKHGVLLHNTRQHIDGIRSYETYCPTITGSDYKEPKKVLEISKNECECVGRIDVKGHDYIKRVYSTEGISPTIPTVCGGGHEPKILEDFYANRDIREYEYSCPTLRADRQGLKVQDNNYRIRKLTPNECFLLQGFSTTDYDICKNANISDSTLYKCAGNSITVTVLMGIFGELFKVNYQEKLDNILDLLHIRD